MENKYWGDTTGSPSVLTMLILINQMEILCKEELFTLPHMSFIYIYIFSFIYLFLAGLGLHCSGFSLVVARRGFSLTVMLWLLIEVPSLAVEHGSMARGLQELQRVGSVVAASGLQSLCSIAVARGLNCSATWGVFLD